MTDEIDTSAERVERLAFASFTASPTDLSAVLRALAAERDAERARAEKAEAALRLALPMMRKDDWGADYGDGTERRDALYATLAALRQDEGGEE